MKRVWSIFFLSFFIGSVSLSVLAALPVAQSRGTKTYKSPHYGETGQMTVTEHHHPAKPGTLKVVVMGNENYYAVDPDLPGMVWLNRNTRGDIFEGGAPLYHSKTGKYHGLFALRPGFYHLNFIDINEVRAMEGYQQLKQLMGNRIALENPKGAGHFVGIHIYGPYDKVK